MVCCRHKGRQTMKKVIFGSSLIICSVISITIIIIGAMSSKWNHNGQFSIIWTIEQFNLMQYIYALIGIIIIGLFLAICGFIDKSR